MDLLMQYHSINDYEFSLERMTSFEGDTGPYLQYAHARLCSISRKAGLTAEDLNSADLSLLTESHAIDLVRVLTSWPDMVQQTLKTLEPTTVLTYLFKMTHMLSSSYDVLQVIGSEPELMKARMALYEAARQVLNNGMKLLGLNPVERFVASFLCHFMSEISFIDVLQNVKMQASGDHCLGCVLHSVVPRFIYP